jgi:hypothetical protein
MSDSPHRRGRWRFALFLTALVVATGAYGGIFLPRLAATDLPTTLKATPDDPVLVRTRDHDCPLRRQHTVLQQFRAVDR